MLDRPERQARPAQLAELPLRLHHHAFVVKDQEVNRHFFEDILGLPLIATWCEKTFHQDFQREIFYCHTFYGLADGGALAFFQFADADAYEGARAILPPGGGWWHIALKVTKASFDELVTRVKRHDLLHRVTDHGYCLSLYLTSPDGLRVEFTVDAANVDAINAKRRADARSELTRWLAGNHQPNNDDRPH
jgi:catechol 2,3-dioxygenase-like lactoylglutathione lyase family enzyme